MSETQRGKLACQESHPASRIALNYLSSLGTEKLWTYQRGFSLSAIEGNRLSEICAETLRRLLTHESLSDRYLMGLALAIKNIEDGGNP